MFLLGAGANVDAGMPTVESLSRELQERLSELRNVNGVPRPDFAQVFQIILEADASIEGDYERFFKWIQVILEAHKDPFRNLLRVDMAAQIVDAVGHLASVLGPEIARLLRQRTAKPAYFAHLADFLSPECPLKVFTLNYDCCLEDACRTAKMQVRTGFERTTGRWQPDVFGENSGGINQYKLHGSLRWHRDVRLDHPQLVELTPDSAQTSPELVLGPASKLQAYDPFLTLFFEFHKSVPRAQACVVIGYGYRDPHINSVIDHAIDNGVQIVDVNPGNPTNRYLASENYKHLRYGARDALAQRQILSRLGGLNH